MKKYSSYVGLDVHAQSISVAVADADGGEVRSLGNIANDPTTLRKVLKKVGEFKTMKVCYESGPCGYPLYWALTEMGAECEVIAPSLIPKKSGDKVKTDRKDAMMLARLLRANELTPVWVPDRAHESLRNLVRAREACRRDRRRAQQRVCSLLLREALHPPFKSKGKSAGKKRIEAFSARYMLWLETLSFEHAATQQTFEDYKTEVSHQDTRLKRLEKQIDAAIAAAPAHLRELAEGLQALRGVAKTTAAIVAIEVGDFTRFHKPTQLMSWAGLTPKEYSTGGPGNEHRFGITKSGNPYVRRLLTESAWQYRHKPKGSKIINKRRQSIAAPIVSIAEKAEQRLHERYWHLESVGKGKGKAKGKIAIAVARELLGFMWAIGQQAAKKSPNPTRKKNAWELLQQEAA